MNAAMIHQVIWKRDEVLWMTKCDESVARHIGAATFKMHLAKVIETESNHTLE